jgi:hypothetical protein
MNVLFLDIDDVICLQRNHGSRFKKQMQYRRDALTVVSDIWDYPVRYRFDTFDQKAVNTLNEILKEADAEVIISSTWREAATVTEIGDYFQQQKVHKRPIGFTEIYESSFSKKTIQRSDKQLANIRAKEILATLENFPGIEKWVAVDDLKLNDSENEFYIENFVHIEYPHEGIKRRGIKEKILSFFTDEKLQGTST